jgi:hypothetical protein
MRHHQPGVWIRSCCPSERSEDSSTLWGEIAPAEHLVQIYEENDIFLNALEGYVTGGLCAHEGVIVIATPHHLASLERRLHRSGLNLAHAARDGQYVALDAARTLSQFMIRGWPDETLFRQLVDGLLAHVGKDGRRVRAFGEMVVLLWNEGHTGATVRLEHLWHQMCEERGFSLLCAYPNKCFEQHADLSAREICSAHSKVIRG